MERVERERKVDSRETIMLVEDEAFVRGVTRTVLESAGYAVVAVRDAREAERAYDQHAGILDLLMTDIVLPGEDGRGLARRLEKSNSSLQILFVTGHFEQMDAGEDSIRLLHKPFTASTLLSTVRQLLDRRRTIASGSG
jgi:two-component system, cell cycle sensor histidine kinase and response regulator CckA